MVLAEITDTQTATLTTPGAFATYQNDTGLRVETLAFIDRTRAELEVMFEGYMLIGDMDRLHDTFNRILGLEAPHDPTLCLNGYTSLVPKEVAGTVATINFMREKVMTGFVDKWLSQLDKYDIGSPEYIATAQSGNRYMAENIYAALALPENMPFNYKVSNKSFQANATKIIARIDGVRQHLASKIQLMGENLDVETLQPEVDAIKLLADSSVGLGALLGNTKVNPLGSHYSHDLKTPLHQLSSRAQMLSDDYEKPHFRENWELLSGLVDWAMIKLTDLDKYLAAENGPQLAIHNIREVEDSIAGVADKYRRFFGSLEIVEAIDWVKSPDVCLDLNVLQLMLDEIFGNAFKYGRDGKYGPKGRVKLYYTIEDDSMQSEGKNPRFVLYVLDYGKGFRMDPNEARKEGTTTGGSTGLGLHFIDKMAGQMMGMELILEDRISKRNLAIAEGWTIDEIVGSTVGISMPIIPNTGRIRDEFLRIKAIRAAGNLAKAES